MDCTEATSAKQKCPEKLLGIEIVQVQRRPTTRKRLLESLLGTSANKATNLFLVSWIGLVRREGKKKKMTIAYP